MATAQAEVKPTTGLAVSGKPSLGQRALALGHRALGRVLALRHLFDGPTPQPDLTHGELKEALRLNNAALVEDIYEIAQRQLRAESERQGRLDSKASGLLTAVGLSLTVLLTYGGLLLGDAAKKLRAGSHTIWIFALVSLGLAVLAGFVAGFCAMRALGVTRLATMNERSIFDMKTLRKADEEDVQGIVNYRRFLIPRHVAKIAQVQFNSLERKAKLVRRGQGFYVLFLVFLVVIGALMFFLAVKRQGDLERSSRPAG